MKYVGISKMGMNSPYYYQNLFKRIDLEDSFKIERVNFEKPYDFILFDGGADVSPDFYGEDNVSSYINRFRDEYELNIFNYYKDTPTKFVGICRGHQLLNVFYGGTLYQDLSHNQIGHTGYHDISFYEHTKNILKEILPKNTYVNSLHHQAVKNLPDNLIPVAYEPNTLVVEIYEEKDDKVRAVQFHPEFYAAFPCWKDVLYWLFRIYNNK